MTAYTFTLTPADTYATIYDSNDRPAATIRRPYATRAAQKAVSMGDMWTVHGTDGALIMARHIRPTRAAVSRAIEARRAEMATAEEAAETVSDAAPLTAEEAATMARAMAPAIDKLATAAATRARRAVSVLPPAMPRAFDMPDSPVMVAIEAAGWMAPDYDAGGLFA